MAYRLACEASDLVAGVVVFSTALPSLLKPSCTSSSIVALSHVQGTEDSFVPWDGGSSSKGDGGTLESISATLTLWKNLMGCGWPYASSLVDKVLPPKDNTQVQFSTYNNCPAPKKMSFVKIVGGGHTWPSGVGQPKWLVGETSLEVNGTEYLWQFLQNVSK